MSEDNFQKSVLNFYHVCPGNQTGHEVDYSILDLVADARAATPTAAGELLCPDREALLEQVRRLREAVATAAEGQLRRREQRLEQSIRLLSARSPRQRVEKNRQRLEYLVRLLWDAEKGKLSALEGQTLHLLRQLELLNPAAVMRKGWSIALREGKTVTTVEGLAPGQELTTLLADGEVVSTIRVCRRKEE